MIFNNKHRLICGRGQFFFCNIYKIYTRDKNNICHFDLFDCQMLKWGMSNQNDYCYVYVNECLC